MIKRVLFVVLLSLCCTIVGAQIQYAFKPKSSSIVNIGGDSYYVHTVKKGETTYSLARLYSVTEDDIVKNNPQAAEGLALEQVLKIPVADKKAISERQSSKIFDQHIVNQGETTYAISKRYGISVATLVEDNIGFDPATLSIGQTLNIRKKSIGGQNDAQINEGWEEYKDALNSVSDNFVHHLVDKGETLYSLSKTFDITEQQLRDNNDLKDGLKMGAIIKIPIKKSIAPTVTPLVAIEKQTVEQTEIENRNTAQWRDIQVKCGHNGKINVAMLLPLRVANVVNKNFLEFYQGALIALEDIKSSGVSVEFNLYNTAKSEQVVEQIVESREFENTDLIIGPVYEECLAPVVKFAEHYGVAVASPLANIEKIRSSVVYQLAPNILAKYDKMTNFISADKNVVVIRSASNDSEFEKEITRILPSGYRKFMYDKSVPISSIEALISGEKDNVFIILSNETGVEEILARISSVQNNLIARSIKNPTINIVGSSRWQRFQNIDKNLYFKLGLCFISSYHADRSNHTVATFDKRYIDAFGAIPSLYSYRGYDATKLFITASMEEGTYLQKKINSTNATLLQMPYFFLPSGRGATNINDQWALVRYNGDYTIEVK